MNSDTWLPTAPARVTLTKLLVNSESASIVAYQSGSGALEKGMHFHPLRHGIGGHFSG
jgi:hypothetical protein